MSKRREERIAMFETEIAERRSGLANQDKTVSYAREELTMQEAIRSGMANELRRVEQLLEELQASDEE